MAHPEGRAARLHGFGMPPATKKAKKTGVTAVAGETTGAGSANITRSKETKEGGKTATEEFRDKYFSTSPNFEISSPATHTDQSKLVMGSLRRHIHFWESIGASDFILSIIREGYKIPFYQTPILPILKTTDLTTTTAILYLRR